MSAIECPSCNHPYKDIQDHIRKVHPDDTFSVAAVAAIGLVPCPDCLRPFKSSHGVKKHLKKKKCRKVQQDSNPIANPIANPIVIPSTRPIASLIARPSTRPIAIPISSSIARAISRSTNRPIAISSRTSSIPQKRKHASLNRENTSKRARQSIESESRPIEILSSPSPASSPRPSLASSPRPSLASSPRPSSARAPRPSLASFPRPSLASSPRPSLASSPRPSSASSPSPASHASIARDIVASNPLLASLLDYRTIQPIEKPLHTRIATLFTETYDRVIASFLARSSEERLYHFLLLPKVLALGLANRENIKIETTLKAYPSIIPTLLARNNRLASNLEL